MESEEQVYINLEELHDCTTKHQGPEKTETKPVRRAVVDREETNTCSPFRSTTVCLGLLCFLLLTTVTTVGVLYVRDVDQLSKELANHTAERHQLLVRYQNLTDERVRLQTSFNSTKLELNKAKVKYQRMTDHRDQLQISFDSAEEELYEMKEQMGTCPDGWKQLGCSCYFLSPTSSTWEESKKACLAQGANLVVTDSREEMEFLNKLETSFWIGLSKASDQTNWMWTDGRPLKTSYWIPDWHSSSSYYFKMQRCAAFTEFSLYHSYFTQIQSWIKKDCSQSLQWVCEKKTEKSW